MFMFNVAPVLSENILQVILPSDPTVLLGRVAFKMQCKKSNLPVLHVYFLFNVMSCNNTYTTQYKYFKTILLTIPLHEYYILYLQDYHYKIHF